MASGVLALSETPHIILPTQGEIEAINYFAGDHHEIERMRDQVSDWQLRASNDLDTIVDSAQRLFADRNLAVENVVSSSGVRRSVPSPAFGQPGIFARAATSVTSLDIYIRHGFDEVSSNRALQTDFSPQLSMRNLLCAAFWEEIGIIRTADLMPGPRELIGVLAALDGAEKEHLEEIYLGLDEKFKLRVVKAKDVKKKWKYWLYAVHPMDAREFERELEYGRIDAPGRGEILQVLASGPMLDAVYSDVERVDQYRRQQRSDRINRLIFEAKRAWKTKTFSFSSSASTNNRASSYEERYIDLRVSQALARYLDFKTTSSNLPIEVADYLTLNDIDLANLPQRDQELWAIADDFAAKHPGKPVSPLIKQLFAGRLAGKLADKSVMDAPAAEQPHLQNAASEAQALPTTAPATWKDDKLPGETPPAFVQRVYGEWLGKGFDRAMLRTLDPSIGRGIDNWLRKNEWPAEVDLPTRGEQNRRILEGGGAVLAAHLGKFTGIEAVRELDRLRNSVKHNR